ncbi:nucleotide-diphospho-sugar transferase [Peziza echinospora]|nr:nucleotide-diphospho-sugar transferase [Peziza echinospora]
MSKKSNASGGGKKGGEVDQDTTLQAVVLADSFQNRFRPLTLEKPRCLLTLANVPLIEYTFEFLALAGVEDVYVFCSAHSDQIDEYIRNSKWSSPVTGFRKLQIIVSPNSSSVGDAMRELDAKQLITADFLLVSGDIVSNLPLEPILQEHRLRRQADKNAIMTMILRQAAPSHRTKSKEEEGVFIVEPETSRCVYYEEIDRKSKKQYISIPPELFKRHKSLEVRNDLIDCYVDICSPDVPALFTENFDYQQIRRHFVHGILQDWELYGKTIHCHIATKHYAARVRSLRTYDAVTKDIISRWTYPLCPDSNTFDGQNYQYQRGNIYKEDNVVLGRSCVINPQTIIGGETSIGDGTHVGNSVIGKNCKIGKNVTIEGSYIWDSVVVEDGCVVRDSIVACNATLGAGSQVEQSAIVSFDVKLAPKTIINGRKRITTYKRSRQLNNNSDDTDDEDEDGDGDDEAEDSSDETESTGGDEATVGAGGKGYLYIDSDPEDSDEVKIIDCLGPIYELEDLDLSDESISVFSSDDESRLKKKKVRRTSGSFATSASEETDEDAWHKEAVLSLRTALEKNHPVEVAGLEINSLRMANDASWHQVRRASASAYVARIDDLVEQKSTAAVACGQVLTRWAPLLGRMIHDREDQTDFLNLIQKECSVRARGGAILLHMTQKLYELDTIEEDAINKWWADSKSTSTPEMVKVRAATQPFITWLAEAEEDEDEEEEDEDEDGDSE